MRDVKIAEVGRAPIFRRPFFWIIALVIVAFVVAPLVGNDVELRESLLLAAVYITLASNLNIMLGFAGYINFGSIVFFGLGGYICVYLISAQGWPLAAAELAAGVLVSLLALVFGLGILRLRGAFFALATIGINEAVQAFVSNFEPWGGAAGLYLPTTIFAPLGGPMRARMVRVIRSIRERGIAILMIEHLMQAIMELSDRVVVLNSGQKLAEGTPKEIASNPMVIKAYLGDPALATTLKKGA